MFLWLFQEYELTLIKTAHNHRNRKKNDYVKMPNTRDCDDNILSDYLLSNFWVYRFCADITFISRLVELKDGYFWFTQYLYCSHTMQSTSMCRCRNLLKGNLINYAITGTWLIRHSRLVLYDSLNFSHLTSRLLGHCDKALSSSWEYVLLSISLYICTRTKFMTYLLFTILL